MKNNELLFALNVAEELSDYGPAIIEQLQVTEKKRLYSLMVEAFRSFSAFSKLIKSHYFVQSCAILRMFAEQMCKTVILSEHQELYNLYEKHCIVREEILDLSQRDRKRRVVEIFKLNSSQYTNSLSYLDYGWIKPLNKNGLYGYHEMLKLACAEGSSIITFIDHLDQFIHQNLNTLSLKPESVPLFEDENVYCSLICFEKFFVAFHNLTGKEFVIKGEKLFEDKFWPLYEKMLKPGDTIN